MQAVTGARTDTRAVAEEFGHTQGPAGEANSEDPPAADVRPGNDTSDFTLGIVGPSERVMDDGDLEGADAALYAADRAQKRGSSDDAVLDALEAAEAAYAAQHQPGPGSKLSERLEEAQNGAGPGSPRGNGMGRSSSGHKGAANVDESTRQKVRERISAGLRRNPNLETASDRVEQIAEACEDKCFHSCSSRTVYRNKAGNAARIAATVAAEDLEDLPRIASGESKQLAADSTAGPAALGPTAGGQGTLMKP